ncbi:cupin domain-containing protein [Halogeometricum borinquense]|uniref:Cupin domain-containing protein n=1 Tax=Halogeometricum borinquense TaxID=60847 RepID=A0A6C0UM41_9EURY|nr:cupin domain-containing protein [Halogeometricum borinquense]QIB76260.1 cupin domain-containing protein [Halogeometricum borinquense]QIQ75306.1 cupin domain-containing protein [Halogeometricum borinquense]
MEHIDVDDIDTFPHPMGSTSGGQALSDELGATNVALNRYTLEPGEGSSGGLHTHLDQEEVFYVLSGTVTFQTAEGSVEVSEDEAVRFAPGDYHHGTNQSDDPATVLAIGAPGPQHDWEQIRVPMPCPDCEDVDALGIRFTDDGETALSCPECGRDVEI